MENNISLRFLYRVVDEKVWYDYTSLDARFREEVCGTQGDISVARRHLDSGSRFYIMAYAGELATGFKRIDLAAVAYLGATFVLPDFKGLMVKLVDTPWLREERDYTVSKYLSKAAVSILEWVGLDIESWYHNPQGRMLEHWRMQERNKWRAGIVSQNLPFDFLCFLDDRLKSVH